MTAIDRSELHLADDASLDAQRRSYAAVHGTDPRDASWLTIHVS